MHPVGRIVVGAFALFIVWTLVRALRRGTIFSRGTPYDINEQPMMFAFVAASHVIVILFFGWLAAGGSQARRRAGRYLRLKVKSGVGQ